MITQKELQEKFQNLNLIQRIYFFETIDSTNTFGISLVRQNTISGTLILAEEQNQGKGRLGRNWISSKGLGLWFSVILEEKEIFKKPLLSMLFAACLTNILKEMGFKASVKWPNDVLVNRKKVCGILAQTTSNSDSIVIGTGINVNHEKLPQDLPNASSLFLESGKKINRLDLLHSFLKEVENQIGKSISDWLGFWGKNCDFFGEEIRLTSNSEIFEGKFCGVSKEGELILLFRDGKKKFFQAGDTTLKEKA
ncbi:MAG: biotin--[acetyl-CoA-carboxylase] ligase [Calditrichaeota bacterium]|nr:MAG: biotin--[acetyl-CoA-carboxylase] ligase [Calditrichota bacterium]